MHDTRLELLIVDDESRVCTALEREIGQLFADEPFLVRSFTKPADVLRYLEAPTHHPFLLISDLRMPELSGAQLLGKVRAMLPELQTILLTAYSDMAERRKAVSTHINSLLEKPWDRYRLQEEIAAALEQHRLRAENRNLREELGRQLAVAAEFQRHFLAVDTAATTWPRCDLFYLPLERLGCGGDYYDLFTLRDGKIVILLADVAGHGIKPAFITGILKTIVQGRRLIGEQAFQSPARLLALLNNDLCRFLESSPDTMVACTALVADPAANTLSVANAGLPPLVLLESSGASRLFARSGPALAFGSQSDYRDQTVGLGSGTVLYLFTDGLVESEAVGPLVPESELASLFAQCRQNGLGAAAIVETFRSLHPDGDFRDDVSLLKLEF